MRICELKQREVINVKDCKRLGFVGDVDFDISTGKMLAIIVPGPGCVWGFLGREKVRESFYSGSQKDTGDCIKKCFASACHRSLFGASCDDYDSSIFLWGDVCRRNQYHAGRKLYERSGRNRCGRFSFF